MVLYKKVNIVIVLVSFIVLFCADSVLGQGAVGGPYTEAQARIDRNAVFGHSYFVTLNSARLGCGHVLWWNPNEEKFENSDCSEPMAFRAWYLEAVPNTQYFRLSLYDEHKYLTYENAQVFVGDINTDWLGAMWEFMNVDDASPDKYVIRNRMTGEFLTEDLALVPDLNHYNGGFRNDVLWQLRLLDTNPIDSKLQTHLELLEEWAEEARQAEADSIAEAATQVVANVQSQVAQTVARAAQVQTITVEIDCYHSSLTNTGTNNQIWVQFWSSNQRIASSTSRGVNCAPIGRDPSFSLDTAEDISEIRVVIDGSDALFIDELRIYKEGRLVRHHGRDNGDGWCLSTDPGDRNGSWSNRINSCVGTQPFSAR